MQLFKRTQRLSTKALNSIFCVTRKKLLFGICLGNKTKATALEISWKWFFYVVSKLTYIYLDSPTFWVVMWKLQDFTLANISSKISSNQHAQINKAIWSNFTENSINLRFDSQHVEKYYKTHFFAKSTFLQKEEVTKEMISQNFLIVLMKQFNVNSVHISKRAT